MENSNSKTVSNTEFDSITGLPFSNAELISDDIMERVASAVVTDTRFLQLLLTGIMSRGHIHLEDVPGTGKTVAAQVLAQSLGVSFNRIQFTPDLLPADITGSHIYNEVKKEFSFQKGPVFSNIVLADEINRAPPKTQAALLEAMGEGQVSIDGTSYELPKPFFLCFLRGRVVNPVFRCFTGSVCSVVRCWRCCSVWGESVPPRFYRVCYHCNFSTVDFYNPVSRRNSMVNEHQR